MEKKEKNGAHVTIVHITNLCYTKHKMDGTNQFLEFFCPKLMYNMQTFEQEFGRFKLPRVGNLNQKEKKTGIKQGEAPLGWLGWYWPSKEPAHLATAVAGISWAEPTGVYWP